MTAGSFLLAWLAEIADALQVTDDAGQVVDVVAVALGAFLQETLVDVSAVVTNRVRDVESEIVTAFAGGYTLNIYEGEFLNGNTPVYTQTYSLDGEQGWRTLELDNILSFAPDQTIWVTFSFNDPTGSAAPLAITSYCGNPDGSWYHFSLWSNSWDVYTNLSVYLTWMIRAVLFDSTGIEDVVGSDQGNFAYVSDGNIIINGGPSTGSGTLQVIDMMGRVIVCRDAMHCVSTSGMAPGVYVLRLINGNDVKMQKIVIR